MRIAFPQPALVGLLVAAVAAPCTAQTPSHPPSPPPRPNPPPSPSPCLTALTSSSAGAHPTFPNFASTVDLKCSSVDSVGALYVSDDVTTIAPYSFNNCKALKKLLFNKASKLKTVGKSAFYGTSLTSVALPPLVTSIAEDSDHAFSSVCGGFKVCDKICGGKDDKYGACNRSWCSVYSSSVGVCASGVCVDPRNPYSGGASPPAMCSKPQKLGTYCLDGKSDEPCSKVAHALASAIVSCTSAQDSRIKIYIPELEYLNLTLASGASPCETGYQHTRRPNHPDACEKILPPARPPYCGERTCEGHGYDREQCAAVGCCQFKDERTNEGYGKCWYDGDGCSQSLEGEALDEEDPDACRDLEGGGVGLGIIVVIVLICLCWPFIIFMFSYCICIHPRQKQQQNPTGEAWMFCCLVFWLICVFGGLSGVLFRGWFVWGSFAWLWGPFFMIIPFCGVDNICGIQCLRGPEGGSPPMSPLASVGSVQVVQATIVSANPIVVPQQPQLMMATAQPLGFGQPVGMATAMPIQPQQQAGAPVSANPPSYGDYGNTGFMAS